jgi:hypothetical protein
MPAMGGRKASSVVMGADFGGPKNRASLVLTRNTYDHRSFKFNKRSFCPTFTFIRTGESLKLAPNRAIRTTNEHPVTPHPNATPGDTQYAKTEHSQIDSCLRNADGR